MRKFLLFSIVILFSASPLFAQVSINTDGSPPDASAILDAKSTSMGFLAPRMTHDELYAIPSPAEGLIVFCTDCGATGTGAFFGFVNGAWRSFLLCTPPSAPTEEIHVSAKTQVEWNWNTVAGATGYKWNTTNNYATATDMGTDTTKTETGLTCETAYTRYAWAYNGCGFSVPVTLTQSTLPCIWSCGDPFTIDHVVSGGVAPVDKSVAYGTVTNIPGETSKCWITRNLGASQQATAMDDNTEASAGWYWQFNRKQGYKHDGVTRTPNTTWITSISESLDWETANDPCALELGSGWRMPTLTEWNNVDLAGNWDDWYGPWYSGLKMHGAGYLNNSSGALSQRGAEGYYWSSSTYTTDEDGIALVTWYDGCQLFPINKANGLSLRCIKE